MPNEAQRLQRNIAPRLNAFTTRYLKKRLQWLRPYLIDVQFDSLVTIQNKDWQGLLRVARKHRREALRDGAAIRAQQEEWGHLWHDLQRLAKVAEDSWKPLGQHDEWPAIRDLIISESRNEGLTKAQADKWATFAETASATELMKYTDIDWAAHQLEAGVASRFSAMAAADLADALGRFNMVYEEGWQRKPAQHAVTRANAEFDSLLRGLHQALSRRKRTLVISKARQIEKRVEELLGRLLIAAAYWAQMSETTEGENNDVIARRSIEVGDTIRQALFALSAARLAIWKVDWPEGSSFLETWYSAAQSKTFESAFTAPTITEIAEVARSPQEFDGKYIAIEGRVGPVTIRHRGRKVISSTSLSDATGAVVQVGLPHIKLDSGGMTPGSSAHVTGTFSTSHDDFQAPVLIPDRRNLTEDGRNSWLDWLTLQLLPVFTPTPHALCLRWSWSRGVNGAGNLLRYGTWTRSGRRES